MHRPNGEQPARLSLRFVLWFAICDLQRLDRLSLHLRRWIYGKSERLRGGLHGEMLYFHSQQDQ
jgi:hypothetical protein